MRKVIAAKGRKKIVIKKTVKIYYSMTNKCIIMHHNAKYQQSLESQLIAIMRTFQRTQPFDQICLKVRSKDIVRKLISVNM